ncbi:hypothetical protein BJX65DRAFT_281716 [Aspergillus insuetus]
MLIQKGADINITDKKDRSALLITVDIRNPAAASCFWIAEQISTTPHRTARRR